MSDWMPREMRLRLNAALDREPNSVECPECEGTGEVTASYNGDGIPAECPYCGGSLVVPLRSAVRWADENAAYVRMTGRKVPADRVEP